MDLKSSQTGYVPRVKMDVGAVVYQLPHARQEDADPITPTSLTAHVQ